MGAFPTISRAALPEGSSALPQKVSDLAAAFQRGTDTLVAGTKTITGVVLTANSVIHVTMRDAGAGALTTGIGFRVPVASRNVGAGSFVVDYIDNAKNVLATAVCTFDWSIEG